MKDNQPFPTPPRWASRLLKWYCAPHLLEEIQGDLEEEFEYQKKLNGPKKARLDYIFNVLRFMRPFALKRKQNQYPKTVYHMNMSRHYLLLAYRNVLREKAFSIINISGLALGLACCIVIWLWVDSERKTDNFHNYPDKLYNVYYTLHANGLATGGQTIPRGLTISNYKDYKNTFLLADDLKEAIPEIQYASMYTTGYELPWGHPVTFRHGEKLHKLEGSMADEDFFKMFNYPVIAGNKQKALQGKSIAISRKMANMFFNSPGDAIGEILRYENKLDLIIGAVFEDLPKESSLTFEYLISWEAFMAGDVEEAISSWHTFIQLGNVKDRPVVESKIKDFLSKYHEGKEFKIELGLQPFNQMYLYSNFENGKPSGGRIDYLNIFSGVGIFILLIACINFMNLATSRSVKRAKEVGVRKTIGSSRSQLVVQFLGESVMLSFLSLVLALLIVQLYLPVFNATTGKQLLLPVDDLYFWSLLTGLTLLTGLVAGSYPALFLSSLDPVRVLKGAFRFRKSAIFSRKGMVVLQYVVSFLLIISTITVTLQTRFMQNTNLGYDRENLIYIRVEGELIPKYGIFRQRASELSGIAAIDRSSEPPHQMKFAVYAPIKWEGLESESNTTVPFQPTSVGFDFLKLMKLELVEGRGFSRSNPADTSAFMVNEKAVKQMGMKDPIGKWISAWDKKGKIIGVLKDYHTKSLHQPIAPIIVDVKEDLFFGDIVVRTEPGKTKEALEGLEEICREINPDYPFAYKFLDHEFEKIYHTEQMTARLSNIFAGLAIIISCLGLLGLVMFSIEQRRKELSLRKILGATISNILGLLSKDFLILVSISFVVTVPLAGYFMNEWLQKFAYRIELTWWIYAISGLAVVLLTVIIVFIQAFKSALANPVKYLRSE
ncbi:MAG: permease prefix domain 2-containing transporter [Cyclobacteriaceae bacterium]|nr:permease prefix domain 2-containing transporter [Cyclobacteriaceae bacterium]